MGYGIWKFLHIMLLVYWLGADLGVFILARAVRRADLTFDQRVLLLKYGMVIDQLPRICLALMLPVSLHLADAAGYVDTPFWLFMAAWIVSFAWVGLLYAMSHFEGTPRQQKLSRFNLVGQAVYGAAVIGAGVALLAGYSADLAPWLALKVLLFGAIFFCAIMIDVEFRPLGPAFMRLAQEGSKPDIEAVITRTVDRTVWWVLALYAMVVIISFLGAVKP